ncbi:unnamed protein product [Zymoseptoria tritici ST99CH_3D7]|uniref:Fungal calcium binding protein domain-containing protein n=1 Tax=Zymoseptoria tritici (strain ST99CH_3D7) TaxID=1276538 RepID=A0A1X7RZB5_ZYMT9|nr:unnamed protein product [Zymoseptoria tritici ST99CH_3D7]
MQFSTVVIAAFAAITYASPVEVRDIHEEKISLPSGCTKSDIVSCALHLVGAGAACGAAVIEGGANHIVDLACVAAAGSTAKNYKECTNCIPH